MNKHYVSQATVALTAFLAAPCVAMDGQAGSSRMALQEQGKQESTNNSRVPSLQALALVRAVNVLSNEQVNEPAKLVKEGFTFGPHADLVELKKALAKKEWDKEFFDLSPKVLEAYFLSLGFTQQDKDDIAPLVWLRASELFPNATMAMLEKMVKAVGLKADHNSRRMAWDAEPNVAVAARLGLLGEIKLAKHFGINLNKQGSYNKTPLMIAMSRGQEAVTRFLVANGATVAPRAANYPDPMEADEKVYSNDIQALEDSNCNPEALLHFLIENDAHIDAEITTGWTPLRMAASKGHVAIARLLIEKGARFDQQTKNNLLMLAARAGREAMVRFLVARDANVNVDHEGLTPLNSAVSHGYEATVRFLIENGADINHRSTNGWTPLMWAVHSALGSDRVYLEKCVAIVRLLIEKGAAVDAQDNEGKTVRDRIRFDARLQMLSPVFNLVWNTERSRERDRTHTEAIRLLQQATANPANAQCNIM